MTLPQQSPQRSADHSTPSDDTIEAIIQHAISSRQDVRPLRDTRTQLFVGNLPYRVRWQDLKDLFRKAGTVLRADVSLGPDNRSRGYGTVLLATAEDAGRAVDMLNGYTWQTRVLEVRLDRLMPEYEVGRVGIGPGVGVAMPAVGPGLLSAPSSVTGGGGLYLGLGISGSGSRGGALNSTHTALGSRLQGDPGTSTDLSLLAATNSRPSHFAHSFVPSRPSSSSAAAQDPLEFLHSSAFTSGAAAELQSTDSTANRTLFVGNLPFHIQWQDLKDLFRQAGTILRADVALGPDNRSRGFGTVIFATEADAERAAKMFNGYEHNGRVLKVYNDKFSLTSSPPMSSLLPPTSYATLNTPASPAQQQYSHHLSPPQYDSSSSSRYSSISSTAAHSAASSPLPGHAVQSSSIHSHHGHTHREYSTLNPQQHPGHITLPPGFLYDYGQSSMPTSPQEFYQRQQQEKEYFERVPTLQQQQHAKRRQEGQINERSIGFLQHQRENLESDSDILRPLALAPATASSVLDVDSLTTSLASMEYSPSSGRPHGSARGVELSLSPMSISASMSVSASGSTSNSNSNPSSNPHSTAPSKPPSTKPTLGAFMSPHYLPSVSSSSLPAQFDTDGSSLGTGLGGIGGTISAGGSRKPSFTSTDVYDRHYLHPHLYPPSISTHTSTDSAMTTESSALSDTGSMAASVTDEDLIGYSSHFFRPDHARVLGTEGKDRSAAASDTGSGRPSRAGSVAGSRPGSQFGELDDETSPRKDEPISNLGRERHGSTSSRGHGQTTSGTQEGKQHPHHPGPIALPPPPSMTFNPMQMPMMPLSTMTPGHCHGHAPTPHAYPMASMMNFSPLYHPAHHGSAAMSAMAAAAMHGGGSPSPFAMYPGPPAMTGAMMSLTPHGLPPITPSMPPFSFFRRDAEGGVADGMDRSSGNFQSAAALQMQRSQPLRLNLNAVQGGFSPGVAMSPGTFYGRPGKVPHPNPYINAAVGAPVHPVGPQSPVHAHPAYHQQPAYGPGMPHGVYPYPIPSPKQDISGGEPQGYFDHVYFPSALGKSSGGGEELNSKEPEEAGQGDVGSPVSGGDEENKYAPSRTHSVGHTRPSSSARGKIRSGSDPMSCPGIRETEQGVEEVEGNNKPKE